MKTRVMILRTTALAALVALALAAPAFAQLDLPRPSPKATISQQVGLTDVSIAYNGRASRGARSGAPSCRTARSGAPAPTRRPRSPSLTDARSRATRWRPAPTPVTIPAKDEWTVILNKAPSCGRVRLQEGRRRAALHVSRRRRRSRSG